MSDVDLLCAHFLGELSDTQTRETLVIDPVQAAREAVATMNGAVDLPRATLVATVLSALIRVSTSEMTKQRQAAAGRVAKSLRSMGRVHQLALSLNAAIFIFGLGLMGAAIYLGLEDRLGEASVVGGLSLLDIALGLLSRPQQGVHESAKDQLQIQIAFNSFAQGLDQLGRHYEWQTTLNSLTTKSAVADLIYQTTCDVVDHIEIYTKTTGPQGAYNEGVPA